MGQIVFVDLETTGLDCERHGILEIGAVFHWIGGSKSPVFYRSDVDPGEVEIDPAALEVNRFTQARISESPPLNWVLRQFDSMVEPKALIAGWNIPFDMAFLKKAYREASIPWRFDYHSLDVWSLLHTLQKVGLVKEAKLNLEQLVENRGLKLAGDGKAHSALQDITWTFWLWHWAQMRLKNENRC